MVKWGGTCEGQSSSAQEEIPGLAWSNCMLKLIKSSKKLRVMLALMEKKTVSKNTHKETHFYISQ